MIVGAEKRKKGVIKYNIISFNYAHGEIKDDFI